MDSLSIAASKPGLLQERCPHPWRRFWARMFDWSIYNRLWSTFLILILREDILNDGMGATLLNMYASFAVMLVIEPFLLAHWGTTPGKWLMGLALRHHSGRKLIYQEGLQRTWHMFCSGNGMGIPFFDWYRNYKCYKPCLAGEKLPWDRECSFVVKDYNHRQPAAMVAAWVLLTGLAFVAQTAAELPKHHGDITAAEFVSNMNDLAGYHEFNEGEELGLDGAWHRKPTTGGTVYFMMQNLPDFQLTEEEGVLKKVHFQKEYHSGFVFYQDMQVDMYLAALSFVGAQKGVGVWQVMDKDFLFETIFGPPGDFTIERAGITIKCRVSGQYTYNEKLNLVTPDDDGSFILAFTMTKNVP